MRLSTGKQEVTLQVIPLEEQKRLAYQSEADPLFFKWKRGEATEQDWLNKINEIKERFK